MIKITRSRKAADIRAYTGAHLKNKLNALLDYYYEDGGNGTVNFKIKTRQKWKTAKKQLKKESHDKCAYCEADTAAVAHGDVEHFRPKSLYWWLAYCYDNYTFSCQICNQSYKSDNFTIIGPRLAAPVIPVAKPTITRTLEVLVSSLCPDPAKTNDAAIQALFSTEDADLPNPYIDNPEHYFAWRVIPETEEVWLVPPAGDPDAARAVASAVSTLGLNRVELLRLRWQAYDGLETSVLAFQESSASDEKKQEMLVRIRRQAGDARPFAGMKRFFLKQWNML
ncbi:hypothetical protein KSS94_09885 [Pseudomonas fakonensis]|uniref:TIGR02646 family protein n=1 Tax=Pseudomonas fakonensis TaxID=2842355 RepID=A0ABX8ND18_9PSED|nr:hypothetical protein [Pseudomonas fakonensis]QXH53398.1 hypothetical protein KSS94_09885 [Pseudomonas fakonensis]